MKTIAIALLLLLLIEWQSIGWVAEFMNLDFEAGDLQAEPITHNSDGSTSGRIAHRLPGWHLLRGTSDLTGYDIQLNAGGFIDAYRLYSTDDGRGMPVEGTLAFMAGRPSNVQFSVSLVQTGLVPADAMSLHFQAYKGPWEVRINGVNLNTIGWNDGDAGAGFQDVSVDVAAWAGQEVELKLTQALPSQWNAIDSIRFSVIPLVPEPGTFRIALVGLLGICTGSSLRGPCRSRGTPG